jgi:hypothetical protein
LFPSSDEVGIVFAHGVTRVFSFSFVSVSNPSLSISSLLRFVRSFGLLRLLLEISKWDSLLALDKVLALVWCAVSLMQAAGSYISFK